MPDKAKRGRRPRRHSSAKQAVSHHTSVPTGPKAYAETRRWLVARHGPVCAYCGVTWPERTLTLDHVTPRRGQSAFDRRDNLVLACKRCNTAKADKPFLVYLLAQKSRATNLLRYGEHLSEGILDLLRHLAGGATPAAAREIAREIVPRIVYGTDDDESPYSDSPYKATPAPQAKARPEPKPRGKAKVRRRR
jgi:5-methylcytosine-specific restriction endonuclease McrA